MKTAAIIVAGGTGERYSGQGASSYKQFLLLGGVPIIIHTLRIFEDLPGVDEIILVVPSEKLLYSKKLIKEYGIKKTSRITSGGKFRQDSVYNGLKELGRSVGIVIIHDGVRPLADPGLVLTCINQAKEYGAAILAVPVKDTIKTGRKMFIEKTADRSKLWSVQTPQCFKYDVIAEAFKKAMKDKYMGTDESCLVERLGHRVKIVEGSYENIKITTPEDLLFAEALIRK